ncbi:MAG: sigma-70 family RNA polymerase sigma factor [Phycisphaerae bacterium]|nr:sigma-70 family RNA polymerase sigma factor [Phycisphaerae bacterium]
MSECKDYITLVRQAQQGHPEARDDLLRIVQPRLAEYIGRLTLDRDLTTDIVQESIAEMLKIFDTLKDPQRFWCWLYTITLNKVRMHYRQRWRRRETPLSAVHEDWLQARNQDVLAELVTKELKEIVVRAVGQLEPRQRAVLTLRCYDQMSYAQISAALGCSQLGARALFYRAKKTLTGLLRLRGIDKGALPVALLVFGKFSATSEAAAASVSIPASTLRVGLWGTLAGAAVQHVAAVLLGTMAVAAGGVLVAGSSVWNDGPPPVTAVTHVAPARAVSQDGTCWYYYPPGRADIVMIRTTDQTVAYSQWLQKEQANYYRQGATITIRNHRQFAPDLSVWRLPTDPPALRAFLRAQDGRDLDLESAAAGVRGLLVAVEQVQAGRRRQATLNYDVSTEDYFRHDWSMDAAIVDQRDDQHRAGWTCFTISGQMGGQPVSGYGRLPLVAAAVGDHGPRLQLTVGNDLMLVDSGVVAEMRDRAGAVVARYPGGSLFQGLGRPWSGLHTIDTIRRDAARAGIVFTTRPLPDGQRVEIVLHGPQVQVTYCVHLYQDWIESIVFSKEDVTIGEWTFSYPQPDEADPHRFAVSSPARSRGQTSGPKSLWLMRLAQGNLVQ